MPSSKRYRSATLAKSPPGSPIRPITKRSRQKTPESPITSVTLPLPLRPTKPTSTSTPTAFNNLKELGPDMLDREETDELDIKKESIIDLKGKFSYELPFKEVSVSSTINCLCKREVDSYSRETTSRETGD
ncbi:hypothetical protein DL95DRAFT_410274 [Leptodontidium sp. 2 PMI_412]|nr:hypothetical protein DL95DRAFT_410274 [Leptodontidium sp. 2 PMI_412]